MTELNPSMRELPSDDTGASPSVYARYGRNLMILLGSVLIGAVVLNVLVDPFGAYPFFSIDALRPYETERGSRTYRAERLRRGDLNVLLTGTSRVLIGLGPSHILLDGDIAYNAGLGGASMKEVASIADYAMEHNPDLELIVLGLDFLMFNGDRNDHTDDYLFSRLNKDLSPLAYHLGGLLSERFVLASLNTVWSAATNQTAPCSDGGRMFLPDYKIRRPPEREFGKILRGFAMNPRFYSEFSYNPERVEEFQRLLVKAKSKGIRVVCYTNSIHATFMELIQLLKMWPMFEQWKRDLVEVVEFVNKEMNEGDADIRLFDFTGCTPVNTEPVSTRTQPDSPLQWFFDASHSYPALGDLELEILLADDYTTPEDSFGVLLTSDNIEEHILLVRHELDQWEADYPDEVAWVENLLRSDRPTKTSEVTE